MRSDVIIRSLYWTHDGAEWWRNNCQSFDPERANQIVDSACDLAVTNGRTDRCGNPIVCQIDLELAQESS